MRRREVRKALTMNVLCRTVRDRVEVALSDISCNGCRIAPGSISLTEGQTITLRPKGLESLTGTVRWCSDKGIGIEFDYPLHPAVVDHLCRLHPSEDGAMAIEFAA